MNKSSLSNMQLSANFTTMTRTLRISKLVSKLSLTFQRLSISAASTVQKSLLSQSLTVIWRHQWSLFTVPRSKPRLGSSTNRRELTISRLMLTELSRLSCRRIRVRLAGSISAFVSNRCSTLHSSCCSSSTDHHPPQDSTLCSCCTHLCSHSNSSCQPSS